MNRPAGNGRPGNRAASLWNRSLRHSLRNLDCAFARRAGDEIDKGQLDIRAAAPVLLRIGGNGAQQRTIMLAHILAMLAFSRRVMVATAEAQDKHIPSHAIKGVDR